MNRLEASFAALRAEGGRTVVPFITAGYPSLAATEAVLKRFDALGLRVCELGIPFTDPIADGPVIQASYTDALSAGVTSGKIFEMVRRFRDNGGQLALVAMVSYSIVFRHGPEAFAKAAAKAGFDGLIVPDLPLEEAAAMEQTTAEVGLSLILLIAPTTSPARRIEIAAHSRGFIYYISIAGITGERTALPAETIEAVAELRKHTDTPICVGFGISNAETVANACRVADGAIVGSAIVHRITDVKDRGPDAVADAAGAFVAELLKPLA